jgi:hypothetical protein
MAFSAEYLAALEAHNVACRSFSKIQKAYRAREIGDQEFIAGRKAYDAATAIYDAAFAKEQN